jgi:hypothetical protein
MAAYNKFNCFVGDVGLKLHNLDTDVLKVYLTNTAPVAGNTVYNTPVDLATSGGYVAGGTDAQVAYSQAAGTGTATAISVVFTATTGFGPFRYAVLYNDTSATKPLVAWWDYGSSVTLLAGETFTVSFGATLFTIV